MVLKIIFVFLLASREIGERMIHDGPRGPECIGYATFLDQLSNTPYPLIEFVRKDVQLLSKQLEQARPRLTALQNALIDLLMFLDPEYVRFPKERRAKVR
jgi:hypothetical protein